MTEVCLPLAVHDRGLPPALGVMATINAVLVVVVQPFATAVRPVAAADRLCGASLMTATGVALTGVADNVWSYAVRGALVAG